MATTTERPAALPGADDVRRRVAELLAGHDPAATEPRRFLEAWYDAGLAWVHHPPGAGGLGLDARLQAVVDQELAAAGAPRPDATRNIIGLGMAAPTVAVHGTPEQRSRYLRPLFSGDEIWCQLFSEPGAGSDLAGLATRAVPDVPKHRGLTYFILDMAAPGVEVRPLRQMTGEAEFNEVYMTDVRLPDSLRLGDVGDGWRVSMTTLMHERVAIGSGRVKRGSGPIATAVRLWQERGHHDPARRDELMRLWVAAEVFRLTRIRAGELRKKGAPGPEGSVAKLAFAELNQAIYAFCVHLMGADGMLYGDYSLRRPEEVSLTAGDPRHLFLRSRANSIEGGTSEVLRNILGERVLGLPGEPRTDRDLPWRDVPRS